MIRGGKALVVRKGRVPSSSGTRPGAISKKREKPMRSKGLFLASALAAFFLVLPVLPARADAPAAFKDAAGLLGADLGTILGHYGVPLSVTSVRGELPWQDDVVFRYDSGLSFFWFKNRVWQIRLERSFRGVPWALAMGQSREEVEKTLGKPFYAEAEWSLYHYAGEGFPIRVRMFFDAQGTRRRVHLPRGLLNMIFLVLAAKTLAENRKALGRYAAHIDGIEVRVDHLTAPDREDWEGFFGGLSFRPSSRSRKPRDGGKYAGSEAERKNALS